jgi:hypothetical protein
VKDKHDGEAGEMGLKAGIGSGTKRRQGGRGARLAGLPEFCREQIISWAYPAHGGDADWPDRPAAVSRRGALVRLRAGGLAGGAFTGAFACGALILREGF